MQNYRNHAMPYNAYRQTQTPPSMSNTRVGDSCKVNLDTYGNKALAMAYVPWQGWHDIYDADKGFHCGTIFQELNLPFLGKGGVKR